MDILLLYPMISVFVWNYNHCKENKYIVFANVVMTPTRHYTNAGMVPYITIK